MTIELKTKNAGEINILSHIIGWALVYMFPELMTFMISGSFLPDLARAKNCITITSLLVVFYGNYLCLIDRYLFKNKAWRFVFINLLYLFLVAMVTRFVDVLLITPSDIDISIRDIIESPASRITLFFMNFLLQVVTILIAISMRGTGRVVKEQQRLQALEKEKFEAELKNLKNKLNPHFLFNALNNIYALTAYDQDKAQSAIESLSKLLRYVLYENEGDMVPLKDEMEFTRSYIDLMALRVDPSMTTLEVNVDNLPEGDNAVATLLLMTLIENAFKHGVSTKEKSFIKIDIHSGTDTRTLEAEISNSLFPKADNDKSGSGIGLDNLKKRLDLLYKDEYIYSVDKNDNEYKVNLSVPLKKLPKSESQA